MRGWGWDWRQRLETQPKLCSSTLRHRRPSLLCRSSPVLDVGSTNWLILRMCRNSRTLPCAFLEPPICLHTALLFRCEPSPSAQCCSEAVCGPSSVRLWTPSPRAIDHMSRALRVSVFTSLLGAPQSLRTPLLPTGRVLGSRFGTAIPQVSPYLLEPQLDLYKIG